MASRAFTLAVAVGALAPLAATTTASAAGGSSHSLRGTSYAHNARAAALKALKDAHGVHALAHQTAATHNDGFVRSQFPARGAVNAMLQLSALPAVRTYVATRSQGRSAATSAARAQRSRISTLTRSVQSHFSAPATSAHTLFTVHNVYAGIAVRTDATRLAALSRVSGVVAVRPLPTYHVTNASTVPLVGAPDVWNGAGNNTGQGVRIGIIDTGIDYTHANFGGTGSRRAYEADHAVADSPTLNVPTGDYPSQKVAGGVDLAGDAYDPASSNPALATPHTDPNPLDCDGHGSHVAGTAAGYGVTSDGGTFHGPYGPLASLSPAQYRDMFRIGPGVAPNATLYGIRVFGCAGSTNLVTEALDWAADPNGDGNFSDHLDVVNMSLGSDFAVANDADSVASNNASLLGITVVASAGNGGDTQAIAGSPANASRVISVAATDDEMAILDAMQENTPVSQKIAGQRNVLYDWAGNAPVTGDVAAVDPTFADTGDMTTDNADGCKPFSAEQAARVKGKIAWEEWTDDDATRRCGSIGRSENAVNAGAIGVILTDDENTFPAGINGAVEVPTFQIRKVDADALRPAVVAGTLNVTLTNDLRNSVTLVDPSKTDQIASFSSRGWGDPNVVKPDIAAPGVSVFSTAMGTGDEGTSESGTSMAAPHTTGMAALVKAAHPQWFPEQIKAALMDTAAAPVTAPNGAVEAPDRVGSGRAQVNRAVGTDVLAYAFGNDGGVGVSFGTPEVTAPTTLSRPFTVENNSGSSETYDLGYAAANSGTAPAGVDYSFSQPSVTVPAHSTRIVSVLMNVDPSQLDRPIDASRDAVDPALGLPNYYLPEASGWITLNQGGDEALRLPLYGAPKATSAMKAASDSTSFTDQNADDLRPGTDFGQLPLSGDGFDTPDYESLVAGFELGASSPQKPACGPNDTDISTCTAMPDEKAVDLKDVGATSDYQSLVAAQDDQAVDDSLTYFAVSTFGPWKSPVGYQEFDVNIDTDGDGKPNAVLVNTFAGTDDLISALFDPTFSHLLDVRFLNGATAGGLNGGGGADTNAFDNNAMVLPVSTAALDALAPSGDISYWVQSFSIYSGLADQTAPASFNFLKPGLAVDAATDSNPNSVEYGENALDNGNGQWPLYWLDEGTNSLDVVRDKAQLTKDASSGLLLLHMNNEQGQTAEVVDVRDATDTAVSLNTAVAQYSQPVKATVTVTAPSAPVPTGKVQLFVAGRLVKTRTLQNGSWTFFLPKLDVRATDYSVAVRYLGDALNAPSTSAPAQLKVVKQLTTTTVTAGDTTPKKGQKDTFTARVRRGAGTTARPAGSVTFFLDGKQWGKPVALVSGVASKSETGFAKGKHTVKAVYTGNANQKPSQSSVSVTVG